MCLFPIMTSFRILLLVFPFASVSSPQYLDNSFVIQCGLSRITRGLFVCLYIYLPMYLFIIYLPTYRYRYIQWSIFLKILVKSNLRLSQGSYFWNVNYVNEYWKPSSHSAYQSKVNEFPNDNNTLLGRKLNCHLI